MPVGSTGAPITEDWLHRLREAALKDEKGTMLDGALKTIATLWPVHRTCRTRSGRLPVGI